jgi:DNA-binding response OmpR family regulator
MTLTILILMRELNPLARSSLRLALEQAGYVALCASTVEEAVACTRRRAIDLVVLDLNRPLSLCWTLFDEVRSLNPAAPIVILTEKKTDFEQAVAESVGALLEKPFNMAALIHTLQVLLRRRARPPAQASSRPRVEASVAA